MSRRAGVVFFGIVVWGSYEPTLHAIASGEYEGEGALRVPVWPARAIVVIGSLLVVVSYVMLAVNAVATLISGREDNSEPAGSTHL